MTLDDLRASAQPVDGVLRFPEPYRLMAVTLEEAEFLYALVRLLKPQRVLELGTGLGVSAMFIAAALEANGGGAMLLTQEPDTAIRAQAEELLEDSAAVAVTSAGVAYDDKYVDLVFIDSGYRHRPADIAHWLGESYAGIVCVHDAARGYAELALGRGVLLPCPDGMWIGRAGAA